MSGRHRLESVTTLWIGLTLGLCTLGCDQRPAPSVQGDASTELRVAPHGSPARLTVDLAWRGAPSPEAPLSWTNNLGFTVQLDEGYLVSHGLGLVPCRTNDRTMSLPPRTGGLLDLLLHWLAPRSARAGHSGDESVPRFSGSYVEALHRPERTSMGSLDVPGDRYCETHYLIARAQPPLHGEPESRSLTRQTLYLRGTWQAPSDGIEPTPFEVLSPLGNGALDPLKTSITEAGEPLPLGNGKTTLHLEISRDLPDLFYGIDFPTMAARDIARQVLKNIVHGTQIREVAP